MEFNEQRNTKTDWLCGIWFVKLDANLKEYLLLQRKPVVPIPPELGGKGPLSGYGQQFVFHENGEMDDSYGAPCRMDGQIHEWSGKWKWNEEEGILFLQVENYPERSGFSTVKPSEAYKQGQEFHITEMTEQMMKLKPKNPSEQLWEYGAQAKRGRRSKKGLGDCPEGTAA
jgi:hypothetical protein